MRTRNGNKNYKVIWAKVLADINKILQWTKQND